MRFLFLLTLLFGALCLANENDIYCHANNSKEGKTCRFMTKDVFIDSARVYCNQFLQTVLTPVGAHSYYAKYKGGQAEYYNQWGFKGVPVTGIFLGDIRFDNNKKPDGDPADKYNWLSSDRCMEYMPNIYDKCGGYGGEYITGYGSVRGICIRP